MQISINRSTLVAGVATGLGVLVALAFSELIVRILLPPFPSERTTIIDRERMRVADCYPRADGVRFPIDLERADGLRVFTEKLSVVVASEPERVTGNERLAPLIRPMSADEAAQRLKGLCPLCVFYEISAASDRFVVEMPHPSGHLALLGDSFVFGQGVRADETFTARLAGLLGVSIHSYARVGANIPEIKKQFADALRDLPREKYSRIAYVYVLNDPYLSDALVKHERFINDLMNIRLDEPSSWLANSFIEYSALARLADQLLAQRALARKTIRWYSDVHDPAVNPPLVETMKEISKMSKAARSRGIDFVVLVYPLMLDMRSYPLSEAHRHLRELAASLGFELHDLLPAFEKNGAGKTLVVHPLDYHPNAAAQSIAATDVAEYLKGRRPKP